MLTHACALLVFPFGEAPELPDVEAEAERRVEHEVA